MLSLLEDMVIVNRMFTAPNRFIFLLANMAITNENKVNKMCNRVIAMLGCTPQPLQNRAKHLKNSSSPSLGLKHFLESQTFLVDLT